MTKHSNRESEISSSISNLLNSFDSGQRRYLDAFIKNYKSASDLLTLGIYPNAKEITESYAALNAAKKLNLNRSDEDITIVCVGDGRSPRTAALFAFNSRWNCISIDPNLNTNKIHLWEKSIQRLYCVPSQVEEIDLYFNTVIICCVHSHAPMKETLKHIKGKKRSMIAIPCCIPYNYIYPTMEYRDSGIWSEKNLVKIWRKI